MGKSKLKKWLKLEESKTESTTHVEIPIKNLPEKFLWMHVKSGTKIRNVLGYALKEFPSHNNSVVWTGVGHGIAKTISCAELFKRQHAALHQVTQLRYTSEKSKDDAADEIHRVPEIHILLTEKIKDMTELGYQEPGNCGEFPEKEDAVKSKISGGSRPIRVNTEQFASMGLRIGQKRSKEASSRAESLSKKNKRCKF